MPMDVKAIVFDIGNTLVHYNAPLSWQSLFPNAIKEMMAACDFEYTAHADSDAQAILTKYNTRVNYREYEVSSNTIFCEILQSWNLDTKYLQTAKQAFYGYFQRDTICYKSTGYTLATLKDHGIKIGALTDVAYGMDNEYVLQDLVSIKQYFDMVLTSNDVGYRKPHKKGYQMLQSAFGVPCNQIAFVGDEQKDIAGANNAGFVSILLMDKSNDDKNWGQNHTICCLSELISLLSESSIR